jgi:uncharacterized membrane protein
LDIASTRPDSSVAATLDRLVAFLTRHWLALVNLGLGFWVLMPWSAPLFMQWGWFKAGRAVYAIYSLFCHQLPQRSWFLFGPEFTYSLEEITRVWDAPITAFGLRGFVGLPGMGWKVAWSDRMVSFYGGFFLFGVLYAAVRAKLLQKGWKMSRRWLILLLAPITLDAGTHMISDLFGIGLGFRETNTWLAALTRDALPVTFYVGDAWGSFNSILRLITGLLGSFALIFWAFPMVDRAVRSSVDRNTEPSLADDGTRVDARRQKRVTNPIREESAGGTLWQ